MRPHHFVCAFLLSLAFSPAARADEDVLSDTARELFVKGAKAYEQQNWEQCRAALLAAFAIKRHNQIAGNLGECELKLGKYRDAAEHAWFFAHTLRPDAAPERRAAAESLLKAAQAKVVTVTLSADVNGATILVDGQPAGNAPLVAPVFLDPGRHTLEALHAGDPGARLTLDAAAGETQEVTLKVKKVEVTPPPPPPVATVQKRPLWPALTAGGVAVVALGVGAGLTGAANAKASDVTTLQSGQSTACFMPGGGAATRCTALHDAATSKQTLSDAAASTFLAAGAAGVVAGGLAIWAVRVPSTAPVRAAPVVGAGRVGVVVEGTW